jgi:phage-related protein
MPKRILNALLFAIAKCSVSGGVAIVLSLVALVSAFTYTNNFGIVNVLQGSISTLMYKSTISTVVDDIEAMYKKGDVKIVELGDDYARSRYYDLNSSSSDNWMAFMRIYTQKKEDVLKDFIALDNKEGPAVTPENLQKLKSLIETYNKTSRSNWFKQKFTTIFKDEPDIHKVEGMYPDPKFYQQDPLFFSVEKIRSVSEGAYSTLIDTAINSIISLIILVFFFMKAKSKYKDLIDSVSEIDKTIKATNETLPFDKLEVKEESFKVLVVKKRNLNTQISNAESSILTLKNEVKGLRDFKATSNASQIKELENQVVETTKLFDLYFQYKSAIDAYDEVQLANAIFDNISSDSNASEDDIKKAKAERTKARAAYAKASKGIDDQQKADIMSSRQAYDMHTQAGTIDNLNDQITDLKAIDSKAYSDHFNSIKSKEETVEDLQKQIENFKLEIEKIDIDLASFTEKDSSFVLTESDVDNDLSLSEANSLHKAKVAKLQQSETRIESLKAKKQELLADVSIFKQKLTNSAKQAS